MIPYYWYYGLLGVLSQFQKNPFFSQSQSNLCFYVKTTAFSSLLFHFSIHSFIHSPIIEHVPCSGDRKNNIWAETWKIIWVLSVLGPYPHGAYILVWEMDSKQVKYIIGKKDNYNLWYLLWSETLCCSTVWAETWRMNMSKLYILCKEEVLYRVPEQEMLWGSEKQKGGQHGWRVGRVGWGEDGKADRSHIIQALISWGRKFGISYMSSKTLKGLSRGGSGECGGEGCSGWRDSHMQRCGDMKTCGKTFKIQERAPHLESCVQVDLMTKWSSFLH